MKYERKDAHYRRAKAAGFRARSAYKLAELDDRYHVIRKGDRVVDLGAWPGGWLQVASDRVGSHGRVVGVDLQAIEPLPASNVVLLVGDVRDPRTVVEARSRLSAPADVVLSDVSPKLSGVRAADEAHSAEVVTAVLDALGVLLKPGGKAAMKVFMDPGYRAMLERLRTLFEQVTTTRPDASRRGSAELYVVATGFRPTCG